MLSCERAVRVAAAYVPGVAWGVVPVGAGLSLTGTFPDGTFAGVIVNDLTPGKMFDGSNCQTIRRAAWELATAWVDGALR